MKFAVFNLNESTQICRLHGNESKADCFDFPSPPVVNDGVVRLIGAPISEIRETVSVSDVELLASALKPRRNTFSVGKNHHHQAHRFSVSGFNPPKNFQTNAVVCMEIDGIGTLEHPMEAY